MFLAAESEYYIRFPLSFLDFAAPKVAILNRRKEKKIEIKKENKIEEKNRREKRYFPKTVNIGYAIGNYWYAIVKNSK